MKGKNKVGQLEAKSMVMQPLFRSRTETDRKKESKKIRSQKHKTKHYE